MSESNEPTIEEIEQHWTTVQMGLPRACELVADDLRKGNTAALEEAIELLRLFAYRERKRYKSLQF